MTDPKIPPEMLEKAKRAAAAEIVACVASFTVGGVVNVDPRLRGMVDSALDAFLQAAGVPEMLEEIDQARKKTGNLEREIAETRQEADHYAREAEDWRGVVTCEMPHDYEAASAYDESQLGWIKVAWISVDGSEHVYDGQGKPEEGGK